MAALRTLSCLALASALMAFGWGVGVFAATTEPTPVDDAAFGGSPQAPELTAAPSPAGRALPGVLANAPADLAADGAPPRRVAAAPAAATARSTALYLSHCALLC